MGTGNMRWLTFAIAQWLLFLNLHPLGVCSPHYNLSLSFLKHYSQCRCSRSSVQLKVHGRKGGSKLGQCWWWCCEVLQHYQNCWILHGDAGAGCKFWTGKPSTCMKSRRSVYAIDNIVNQIKEIKAGWLQWGLSRGFEKQHHKKICIQTTQVCKINVREGECPKLENELGATVMTVGHIKPSSTAALSWALMPCIKPPRSEERCSQKTGMCLYFF